MKYAAEVLHAAAPTLEKTGVVIALEPLGPDETNSLTTRRRGGGLVALVDSPTCRLHLDCKAMAAEEAGKGDRSNFPERPAGCFAEIGPVPFSQPPIPEIIHKYRKLFVHFHANDPNHQGPGFGKLDFVPIMKALGRDRLSRLGLGRARRLHAPASSDWRGKASSICGSARRRAA